MAVGTSSGALFCEEGEGPVRRVAIGRRGMFGFGEGSRIEGLLSFGGGGEWWGVVGLWWWFSSLCER